MAIKTSIISRRFPYIPLQVQVRQRKEKIEALLDIGFDGDIAIPKGLLTNGDPPDGLLPWQLADGSRIIAPAYIGRVKIGNIASFPVVIIALGDESIVGQGVIKNLTITLDHGRKIVIER
jgi:predicted aspartyl protease